MSKETAPSSSQIIIQPQPGPQTEFLHCEADMALYGGAAGGGKSMGLLLQPLLFMQKGKGTNAEIYRRYNKDLTLLGGLWAESQKIYSLCGGKANQLHKTWTFPGGNKIKFSGIPYEKDIYRKKGSQLDILLLDELTEFTPKIFWYLFGRLRSEEGHTKPFIRMTSNPEPGWIADMISWWLLPDGGADPEKSGKIRWFFREDETLYWYDSVADAIAGMKELGFQEREPISFTFISAKLSDNKILLQRNPFYYTNLLSQNNVEKMRLLYGNWKVSSKGKVFDIDKIGVFSQLPAFDVLIITIDTAQKTESRHDFTVAQLWGRSNGKAYLISQSRGKYKFLQQIMIVRSLCLVNKPDYVFIEEHANGLPLIESLSVEIKVPIVGITRSKDKYSRALDVLGYIDKGLVFINPEADYYVPLSDELNSFTADSTKMRQSGNHDDQVDAFVDGIYYLLFANIQREKEKTAKRSADDFSLSSEIVTNSRDRNRTFISIYDQRNKYGR